MMAPATPSFYTSRIRSLAIEFAYSTLHSLLVTVVLTTVFKFVMALYNAYLCSEDALSNIWPPKMTWSHSNVEVLIAYGAVLLGLVLAALWYFSSAIHGTREGLSSARKATNAVVNKVRADQELIFQLKFQCQSQLEHIQKVEAQLEKAYARVNDQTNLMTKLQKLNENHSGHIHAIEACLTTTNNNISILEKNLTAANVMVIPQLHDQLKIANRAIDDLDKENMDLRLRIECIGTTVAPSPNTQDVSTTTFKSLLTAPFVLVLVDGDAYRWSQSHWHPSVASPGDHAAKAVKREVQEYILNNRDHISPQCRIITCVFVNAHGLLSLEHNNPTARRRLGDFGKAFTESGPLSFYIDCGEGKERADSKIQGVCNQECSGVVSRRSLFTSILIGTELAHIFVNTPNCHKIFFAAASDNGFARFLEQYTYDASAMEKLLIIHPGYVAREIGKLGFTSVEWASVFANHIDNLSLQKANRDAIRKEHENRKNTLNTTLVIFDNVFRLQRLCLRSSHNTVSTFSSTYFNSALGKPITMLGLMSLVVLRDGQTTSRDEGIIEEVE